MQSLFSDIAPPQISTGTGIAPFLQLLTRLRNRKDGDGPFNQTRFRLIQFEPRNGSLDLAETAPFLPALRSSDAPLVGLNVARIPSDSSVDQATTPFWGHVLFDVDLSAPRRDAPSSQESSSWWSKLTHNTPSVPAVQEAPSVCQAGSTRGAIICLPKV